MENSPPGTVQSAKIRGKFSALPARIQGLFISTVFIVQAHLTSHVHFASHPCLVKLIVKWSIQDQIMRVPLASCHAHSAKEKKKKQDFLNRHALAAEAKNLSFVFFALGGEVFPVPRNTLARHVTQQV